MKLLVVSSLSKAFGGNLAVDKVGFELAAGELVALIGPNGAGKSTVFNMLNGQIRPDGGSIRLAEHELVGRLPREIWRLGVGRTFQIAEIFASLTVVENVQMALLAADRQLWSMWRRAASYRRDAAIGLLAQVGMADQADRPCSELAYGDVKRVELATATGHAPRLLLMDEPTAGMSPPERVALMVLVRKWVDQRRLAVLFTEHSMDVVFEFADRIVVMDGGRVIADAPPPDIRRDLRVQQVYFGSGKTFEKTTRKADAA